MRMEVKITRQHLVYSTVHTEIRSELSEMKHAEWQTYCNEHICKLFIYKLDPSFHSCIDK
jgi:hypothetical protein